MIWAGIALALLSLAWLRVFAGHPQPGFAPRRLARRELAFLAAAADATFPAGGAIPASGCEAGIPEYVDRWVAALDARTRRLVRLLFFLVEHATLIFPTPGWGLRRFSALSPAQQCAALEGWRTSRLAPRRLVFQSLRAILTMGYFAHPPVLRQLGLAPRAIDTPVCEADLLFPPIGLGPEAIACSAEDVAAARPEAPLTPESPLHPLYAEDPA